MRQAVLDSSIYIAAMRNPNHGFATLYEYSTDSTIWLSSVVLQELYAGATDRNRFAVESLEAEFRAMNRILVPNLNDWTKTGRLLAQLAAKYHYEKIGRARLTSDALIAVTASRLDLRVITANERDFRKISEFCSLDLEAVAI
jgi:predicted nucleic acid-binding protein